MLHRSFSTGLAAIALAVLCMYAGLIRIAPSFAIRNSDVIAESSEMDLLPLRAEPEVGFLSGPSSPSTSTRIVSSMLHEPPLEYLRRVKGNPRLEKNEVAIRVPVLMYHHIRPMKATFTDKDRLYTTTPEAFEIQMESLKQAGYVTISPRELEEAIEGRRLLPEKAVLLTFDDGYREHYTRVLPILQRLNLRATYFIISDAHRSPAHMTLKMIQEADQTGLITIAAHTRHHVHLARASVGQREAQIAGSKNDLETLLGHDIQDFAYPFGSWSQTVADEVKQAGYSLGFGIRLGSLHGESSRYQLRRIRVLDGENVVSLLDAFSEP